MMKNFLCCLNVIFLFSFSGMSQHVELGAVQWLRNYDQAVKKASSENKDILILFQEVPGCATCRNYGNDVLSHPLIVEAIEDNFVPLAIFNNHKGHDLDILKQFEEASWNNPVVRIVNMNGQDIVDRLSGQYFPLGLVTTILRAMETRSISIPKYLQLLHDELQNTEELVLGMYCFWTGEKVLGDLRGVIRTEAGYMGGHEVVKLRYNPAFTDATQIINSAKSQKCADLAFVEENIEIPSHTSTKPLSAYRKDKEDKYYLLHSKYKNLSLSAAQATKVNSYLGQGLDPEEWLSPRQLELLK
jgi:hypothetical protein